MPDTPNASRVEEARREILDDLFVAGNATRRLDSDYTALVDAFAAAVRSDVLAQVKAKVEAMPEDDDIQDAAGETYDERESWRRGATKRKYQVLAALDALEGKTP